jgi:hypothetical protein
MSVTDTRPRRSHSRIRYRWVPSAVRREFDLPPESGPPGPLMRLVHDQRVAFLVVGGINTIVGFGIFVARSETVGRWPCCSPS